jgi:hypothetical protein
MSEKRPFAESLQHNERNLGFALLEGPAPERRFITDNAVNHQTDKYAFLICCGSAKSCPKNG